MMTTFSKTRRRILKNSALLAGAAVLQPAAPFVSRAFAQTQTLRMLIWEGYAIKETIAEFEQAEGVRIAPTFFAENSEAFNKLKVGGTADFDIVMADGFWPRLYYNQGLTKGLDYGQIPNIARNVYPDFLPSSFKLLATEDGSVNVAAPNCWGGYGITMNIDQIAPEDRDSLTLLLNEKYGGHLASSFRYEENVALMGILAATNMGTISQPREDGQPFSPYRLTDAELEEAKKLLIEQKKLILSRYQDETTLDRMMRGGAVYASPEFSATYRRLKVLRREGKLGFDVDHMLLPKEGGIGWVDTWMISSGADSEHTEMAHKWINHYLTKKNFVRVVRQAGYSPTVDVRDMLTEEENELYFTDRTADASQLYMFDQPSSPEKWERIWSEVEAS